LTPSSVVTVTRRIACAVAVVVANLWGRMSGTSRMRVSTERMVRSGMFGPRVSAEHRRPDRWWRPGRAVDDRRRCGADVGVGGSGDVDGVRDRVEHEVVHDLVDAVVVRLRVEHQLGLDGAGDVV